MLKNHGGHSQVSRDVFFAARDDLSTGGGGEGCKSKFEARRAFLTTCIRVYRPDGLAGIFEGFEKIFFVPAGSDLGTYVVSLLIINIYNHSLLLNT